MPAVIAVLALLGQPVPAAPVLGLGHLLNILCPIHWTQLRPRRRIRVGERERPRKPGPSKYRYRDSNPGFRHERAAS